MLEQRIEEVNQANRAFYAAFGSLDINEMDKVWAHQEYVTCIHPGWSLRSDWPEVRDSWVLIFNNTFSMTFVLTDVTVQVAGDLAWGATDRGMARFDIHEDPIRSRCVGSSDLAKKNCG